MAVHRLFENVEINWEALTAPESGPELRRPASSPHPPTAAYCLRVADDPPALFAHCIRSASYPATLRDEDRAMEAVKAERSAQSRASPWLVRRQEP